MYEGLFKFHGLHRPSKLRRQLAQLIRFGCKCKFQNQELALVDLLAKLEVDLRNENKCEHALGLLQVYKVIHVSNGISEIIGHIVNEMVKGVRLRMGVMMMENLIRLHHVAPLVGLAADLGSLWRSTSYVPEKQEAKVCYFDCTTKREYQI